MNYLILEWLIKNKSIINKQQMGHLLPFTFTSKYNRLPWFFEEDNL